jgi:SPX domain protein involved in polyphosphate accumulation
MDEPLPNLEEFRYERKFAVSELSRHEIDLLVKLHPATFVRQYRPRFVNSLYLDSVNFQNYLDNVNGHKQRAKARFRWYGRLFGFIKEPSLEIKIKNGSLGRKQVFPLAPFTFDEAFRSDAFKQTLRDSEIPVLTRQQLLGGEPTVLSRYKRNYYISADHKYRLTIDTEIAYYQFTGHSSSFLHRSVDHMNTIVELKYRPSEDQQANQITNHFPFRITRSSKYSGAVERLYPW